MSKRQNDKLLEALKQRPMTAGEIWKELGIARASARVLDLRREGHDIRSKPITVRTRDGSARVALYEMRSGQQLLIPTTPGRGVMVA
jgi:hypothetical protein